MEAQSKKPLQMICETKDGESEFLLTPADEDRFMRTGKQVIDACKLDISVEVWMAEVHAMFEAIRAWASKREDIECCLCRPKVPKLEIFVVPRCEQFDFDLADGLADFNLDLMNRFNVGIIELVQVPCSEVERFLEIPTAVRIYG